MILVHKIKIPQLFYHSYTPRDRVFGQMERIFKRQRKVVRPEEYVYIMEKFVCLLLVFNFKAGSQRSGEVNLHEILYIQGISN